MNHTARARAEARAAPILPLVVLMLALVLVFAAMLGALGDRFAPPAAATFGGVPRGDSPAGEARGPLGEADGLVPDGASALDDGTPAVANLDPGLLEALRRATWDAAEHGVKIVVNSGWRSPEYQEQLLRSAVAEHGSEEEAARWVGTPATSAHVSGDAVDIGPFEAAAWLSKHGAGYGLCRTYLNEPWHFELRPAAVGRRCPPLFADPTEDPRMQR